MSGGGLYPVVPVLVHSQLPDLLPPPSVARRTLQPLRNGWMTVTNTTKERVIVAMSGGVDSSVILSCMARLNDFTVTAYTIGFPGAKVADEREKAGIIAKTLGAKHIEVTFDEDDFWKLLPRVTAAMDEPAADYAILPTWKLAQTAAINHKVILSGEGGDEIFGGYGRYRSLMRPLWLAGRGPWRRGILDGLGVLREETPGWRVCSCMIRIPSTK